MNFQRIMLGLVLSGIMLLFPYVVVAQTNRFLVTQLGLGNQMQRDEGMSALQYQGATFGGGISYLKGNKRKTEWLEMAFSGGMLKNRFDNDLLVYKGNLTSFIFYHSDKAYSRWVSIGWSNQNLLSYRQNTSFTNYKERIDYFTCFGPAANFFYHFPLGKTLWDFQVKVNYQVVGFFIRPSFATNEPEGFVDQNNSWLKGFFRSVELFIPGKAMSFRVNPSLTGELKSGNFLSLGYDFSFYRLNSGKPVQQLDGFWSITWVTRLSQLMQNTEK